MAIASVGQIGSTINSATSSAQIQITVGASGVSAGDFIIVGAIADTDTETIVSVVDNAAGGSNTYQVDKTQNTAGGVTSCYIVSAIATRALTNGKLITITFSNDLDVGAAAWEFSGITTSSWLDKTAGQEYAFDTAWSSGSTAATTQASELLIGCAANDSGASGTPGGSFTEMIDTDITVASRGFYMEYRIVAATGTYAATGTWAAGSGGPAAIATYKAATAVTDNMEWLVRTSQPFRRVPNVSYYLL